MNNDNELTLKEINISINPAEIIHSLNEPFIILLTQSFPFLETMLRSHEIERRRKDIFPGLFGRKRETINPTVKAFEDVRRLFRLYVPIMDENLRKTLNAQKGLNELVLSKKEKISPVIEEIIEIIIEKKVDEYLAKNFALLTGGNIKSVS